MSTPDVTPFHSQLPVKLSFGDGVIAELGDVLASLGASRAFVVIEEPVVGNEGVEAALAACAAAGIQIERYLKGSGEPTIEAANTVTRAIAEDNCDAVVGIGGGSALDLAKAARLLADAGGSVWDYLEGGRPFAPPSLPLVLCPTTSGTGSEVSGASVLTDSERDRKVGVANGLMRAQHALVDPLLTLGLPPGPTSHSGVDALAQAIGACTVRDGSPLSVAFGLEAVHHVGLSLERAVRDGSDRDARRQLSCGSLTAGLAMNLSDCAADHALGQAIGSKLHLPHGLTVGLVLAETLDRSRVELRIPARAGGRRPRRAAGRLRRRLARRERRAPRPALRVVPDRLRGGRARGARRAADRADAHRAGLLLRLRLPRLVARRGRRRLP